MRVVHRLHTDAEGTTKPWSKSNGPSLRQNQDDSLPLAAGHRLDPCAKTFGYHGVSRSHRACGDLP